MRNTLASLAVLTLLVACGDDPILVDSAAPDGSTDGGAREVAPPIIPWLALDGPATPPSCPDGWRVATTDGASSCEPFPESGIETCARGEAHFIGEPGCSPVGAPCPGGEFGAELETGAADVYVQADAPPGGDGFRAAPLGALSEVRWTGLAVGSVVALGRGTFEGTLPLKAGVIVVGACARETVVTGVAAPVPSVVTVTGSGEPAVVRDSTIADAPQRGVIVGQGRALHLEGVGIERTREMGIEVRDEGTVLTAERLLVRDTLPGGTGELDRGINVWMGARLDAEDVVIEGNRTTGLYVSNAGRTGSEAILRDVLIRDTAPESRISELGRGVNIQRGARVELTRFALVRNREFGLIVSGSDSFAALTDGVIRSTLSQASDLDFGRGIGAQFGGRVEASRVLVEGNRDVGIFIGGESAGSVLNDVIVRNTLSEESDGTGGRGVNVQLGAGLEANRLLVDTSLEVGVYAHDEGTTLTLTDTVIRDTEGQEVDGSAGHGLEVGRGARAEGIRIRVERSGGLGVMSTLGAQVILEDVSVFVVEPSSCEGAACRAASFGYGLSIDAASLRATRFEIADAETCGVFLSLPGTEVDLASGVISGSMIGACIQVDGFDLGRLSDDVEYRDNGTNLDVTTLPVPEPTLPETS